MCRRPAPSASALPLGPPLASAVKMRPSLETSGRKVRRASVTGPASTLTALGTNWPASASSTCSAMVTPALSCASAVEAPRCGVTTTLSRPNSGLEVVGSSANTSRAAPARWPDSTALASAVSSTIPPRAVLTRRAPGLTAASSRSPSSPTVSGVLGRWMVTMSARARTSARLPSSTPSWAARWKRERSQRPSRRAASARGMSRACARISAMVCSAAEITFDCGALTTMIPSRVAVATSTLSRPIPARPTTLRLRPASSTSASTRVAERTTSASAPATASSSSSRVMAAGASTWWSRHRRSTPASASGSAIRMRAICEGSVLGVPQPGHHRPERPADLLDLVLAGFRPEPVEVRAPGVVLGDQLAREGAGADLGEDALHLGTDAVVDHPRPARVVAVLGRVRDRVAHPLQATLVDHVHDHLQLVEALEVGDLRLIAGLDQGVEAGLDERADTAAQHRLLAEQVGLGLLLEGGHQRAGPGAADPARVRLGQVPGLAAGVLRDGHQAGRALALLELAAHQVAGALGRDHRHVHALRRLHVPEVDVEAVGEEQCVAWPQVRRDVTRVEVPLHRVGHQHHDQVGPLGRLGGGQDLEARRLGLGAALGPLGEADPHLAARVLEAQRVGVPLGAVAEYGDLS